jgi:hypothetical protein
MLRPVPIHPFASVLRRLVLCDTPCRTSRAWTGGGGGKIRIWPSRWFDVSQLANDADKSPGLRGSLCGSAREGLSCASGWMMICVFVGKSKQQLHPQSRRAAGQIASSVEAIVFVHAPKLRKQTSKTPSTRHHRLPAKRVHSMRATAKSPQLSSMRTQTSPPPEYQRKVRGA